jgi:hypothetical protein
MIGGVLLTCLYYFCFTGLTLSRLFLVFLARRTMIRCRSSCFSRRPSQFTPISVSSFRFPSIWRLWQAFGTPLCAPFASCGAADSILLATFSVPRFEDIYFSYSLFAFLPLVPTAFHTLSRLLCTHGSLASTLSLFGHPFFDLLMSVVLL